MRVISLGVGGKSAIATHFEKYEYLPAEIGSESSRNNNRAAASNETPKEEAGVTMHTFDWRGVTPLHH
jgi:hypothetical protein